MSDVLHLLESYIEAASHYLDAMKLLNSNEDNSNVGLAAVHFGHAFLALTETDNVDAIKFSLAEAIEAYSVAIKFYELDQNAKQYVYIAKITTDLMKLMNTEMISFING